MSRSEENPIMCVDHIGIVSRYETAIRKVLNDLGGVRTFEGPVDSLGVTCTFFNVGNVDVEVVTPDTEESVVSNYYVKYPEHPLHHIAVQVSSINEAVSYFKRKGYRLINAEVGRSSKDGYYFAFLAPLRTGGLLIEVMSKNLD